MPALLQITDKPMSGGGIRRVVEDQTDLLRSLGWSVKLLELVHRGVRVRTDSMVMPVPLHRLQTSNIEPLRRFARDAELINLHLGFYAISPDFVSLLADQAPLVASLHDISPFEHMSLPALGQDARSPPSLLTRIAQLRQAGSRAKVWQRLVDKAQMFLAPSRYLARLAVAAGADQDKVLVVPHTVPLAADAPPPSAAPLDVLYAGRLSAEKGAAILIEAFVALNLPHARLILLGEGPLATSLKRRVYRAGAAHRILFHGHLPPSEVAAAMARARAVVQPSLVPEGLGLSGIEAMQRGRPVIGFGLGGMEDWLRHDETGLIPEGQTAAALTASLRCLLTDDQLADRLGAGAKAFARQHFSASATTPRLLAALHKAQSLSQEVW